VATCLQERRFTARELLSLPDEEWYELLDGRLIERPVGGLAASVAGELLYRIASLVHDGGLGWVLPSGAGYQCFADDPERVRRPSVSFVAAGRFPANHLPKGHCGIPPDLAVEVIYPDTGYSAMRRKVEEYLRAGVRLVWVIDPEVRVVDVWSEGGRFSTLREGDELTGEDVLPGFCCVVADLLPPLQSEVDLV